MPRAVPGMRTRALRPWYRELWPWLLFSGPAIVVIAGLVTLWLAMASNDGLVADDYYKRGLAINRTLSREKQAAASGYRAQIAFGPAFDRVRIVLNGGSMPRALAIRMVHPTRAGLDRAAQLRAVASGVYEGPLAVPQPGNWHVIVEDDLATWRLHGDCSVPAQTTITLGGQ